MDLAVMRAMPNMTVIVPADNNEIVNWLPVIAEHEGPIYFRMSRDKSLPVHPESVRPKIGKGIWVREGSDVTLIANGAMLGRALQAADLLAEKKISAGVLELHTLKPLDVEAICQAAQRSGAIVTAEEHTILGGLGGAVAEVLAVNYPVPLEMVGVKDHFPVTAKSAELLMDYMGLRVLDIVSAAEKALRRKEGS
jgi:transketolase